MTERLDGREDVAADRGGELERGVGVGEGREELGEGRGAERVVGYDGEGGGSTA